MSRPGKKYALVLPCYSQSDPPTVNAIQDLVESGYEVVVFSNTFKFESRDHVTAYSGKQFAKLQKLPIFRRTLMRINAFMVLGKILKKYNPVITIAFMHAQVALIGFFKKYRFIACIYDVPNPAASGKIDRIFINAGLKRLRRADLVWCSDVYKAEITQRDAQLKTLPIVCHNCPRTNYLSAKNETDIAWLQNKVREFGAANSTSPYVIMARAGAVGIYGGIEETIVCMNELPEHYILLLMGRPGSHFKSTITDLINEYRLGRRVFFIENPDEVLWKKVLLGAQIGHMIHLRPEGNDGIAYDLNSSLSNNRLFQYMAASTPILSYNDKRLDLVHSEVDCFKVADMNGDIPAHIRNIWKELGENESLQKTLGTNGRKAHLQKYNWETQFRGILSYIKGL